jgi:molybdopterin-guanine dinucleotide biosynthesis protein A
MIAAVKEPATLLVLAGGQSRRMGRDKALLPVAGATLIEYVVDRLAPAFEEVLVSAGSDAHLPSAVRGLVVCDLHPGAGPLAGIEAGLLTSPHELVMVVACDMPWLTTQAGLRIAAASSGYDAAVPRLGGRPEPACAAYRSSAAATITAALEAGRFSAREVLGDLEVRWLDGEDPDQFASLNSPRDYQAFLDALRKTR